MVKIKNHFKNSGFTLIEVMISLAIFAVFASAYLTTQGYNLLDSSRMKEEIVLQRFVEEKINEIIVSPPELKDSLTLRPDSGTFKSDNNFSYKVTYKKFIVPDLTKIQGKTDNGDGKESAVNSKIFDNIKKNLEKMIWQMEVTVKNKTSERTFSASTWLYNRKAEVIFQAL